MINLFIAIIIVPIIASILVIINYILAPRIPQYAKLGVVECGIITLTNQSRQPYSIVFYIVAVIFIIFDIEVVLIWPFSIVISITGLYGFWIITIFTVVLGIGFVIELASGALKFDIKSQ